MSDKHGFELHGQRPPLLLDITYAVPVPDGLPIDAMPLSGFAPSLCFNYGAFELASFLPSHISDYTADGHATRISRRMVGQANTMCFPQTIRALTSYPIPAFAPFMVVLSPNLEIPEEVHKWASVGAVKPIIVSPAEEHISKEDVTWEILKLHFLESLSAIRGLGIKEEEIEFAEKELNSWVAPELKDLGYKVKGHGSVLPNIMSLNAMGHADLISEPFSEYSPNLKPYTDQIVLTTNSIVDLRTATGVVPAFAISPPTPALSLYSVGLMAELSELSKFNNLQGKERVRAQTVMDLVRRQDGYSFHLKNERERRAIFGSDMQEIDEANPPLPHPIFFSRQLEVNFSNGVVGRLSASEASAVIRLPNSVNRSIAGIKQFAQHYRSKERSKIKRIRTYKLAKKRISESVPDDFITLIKNSPGEIRVISDAHLEWLDIDGLPLFATRNLSRIAVTPGNLFVTEMGYKQKIRLSPRSFSKILVINGLKDDDPIDGFFEDAFDVFSKEWKNKLDIVKVNVSSVDEFIKALNDFDGPLVVFDGHGSHERDESAKLHFQDESCDIWKLRGRIKNVPPIMILSACDTHAADRNHATVANGFLSIGVRSVLASVFPLDARDAALFTARLLYRLAAFLEPAVNTRGQPITWTEVIGGLIRMQLLSDFLQGLLKSKAITKEVYLAANNVGNIAINSNDENPFEVVLKKLEEHGMAIKQARIHLTNAPAQSSALAYLNIGRSETILIDTEERLKRAVNMLK